MSESGIRIERRAPDFIAPEAKIRPLRDHIIVKPLNWEPSKIIRIAGGTRGTLRGIIVAAGPGHFPKRYNAQRSKSWDSKAFQKTEVKVGDVVELGGLEQDGYSFPEILWGTERYLVCREADVCGICLN